MEFIEPYQKELFKINKRENLLCLSDDDVKFNGKNALLFIQDQCSDIRNKINTGGIFDKIVWDIIFSISQDIKYSLGNVYIYKDLGINNFLTEKVNLPNGESFFSYFQTLGDKRFLFYVSVCFEKLYNYWDRIGDLIALCFNLEIDPKQIYFPVVIDELKSSHSQSMNFQYLENFKKGDYQNILNHIRKLIVHYRQKDTYFRFEFLSKMDNPSAIKKLQEEKDQLPELLKNQMHKTISGFESSVRLIGEIN